MSSGWRQTALAKILNASWQQTKEWGLIQAIGRRPGGRQSSPHSFLKLSTLSTSYKSPPLETPSKK